MALVGFPPLIDVILGANWDGTHGLAEDLQLMLTRYQYFPTVVTYTESGGYGPDIVDNRLALTAKSATPSVEIVGAYDQGTPEEPDVDWTDAFDVDGTGEYGDDYTFRELWLASPDVDEGNFFAGSGPFTYNPGIFKTFQGVGTLVQVSPVALTITPVTPLIPIKVSVSPVELQISVPSVTPVKSVTVSPVTVTISIPAVTITEAIVITPPPLVLTLTVCELDPGIVPDISPLGLTLTVPAVTVAHVVIPTPLVLTLTIPQVSGSMIPSTNIPFFVRSPRYERPLKPIHSQLINPAAYRGKFFFDGRGLYRVFNAAEYRFYRHTSRAPRLTDSPFGSSGSLPATPAETFADDATYYLSVSWFNGVIESDFLPIGPLGETYLVLEISGGQQQAAPPHPPSEFHLQQRASGVIRVHGLYIQGPDDANRADQWALAYTTDESTPPVDNPDLTPAIGSEWMTVLMQNLPGQSNGTIVTVRLQTRRNDGTVESPDWIYSDDSTVVAETADAAGPAAPPLLERWPGILPAEL